MVLSLYKNTPRGRHQNGKLRKTGGNKSHSSSSVYSCSCKSFVFHWNGTASGFIKIYELNYHWKYKTLVGAQGRHRTGGGWGADGERKEWCWLETTRVKRRTTDEEMRRKNKWVDLIQTFALLSFTLPLATHLKNVIKWNTSKARSEAEIKAE